MKKRTVFILGASSDIGVSILKSGSGYWNGIKEPNSSSLSVAPTVSYLINSKIGALSFNVSKPFYYEGTFKNEGDVAQGSDIWQFTVSVRKI